MCQCCKNTFKCFLGETERPAREGEDNAIQTTPKNRDVGLKMAVLAGYPVWMPSKAIIKIITSTSFVIIE